MLLATSCTVGLPPAEEEPSPAQETAGAEETAAQHDHWLAAISSNAVLTYEVRAAGASEPGIVRMLVQQRIERGGSIAVHLAPIGTPLGETPVYPQWLIGTADGLSSLEEHAAFTEPGFVPIDAEGRLVTEAANSEAWRVDPDWLRADRLASGEAAVGWTLVERVPTIEQPIHASRCVRLERSEGSARSLLLVCADVGIVERGRSGDASETWRLIEIGAREAAVE
jgi:hypothetical protein